MAGPLRIRPKKSKKRVNVPPLNLDFFEQQWLWFEGWKVEKDWRAWGVIQNIVCNISKEIHRVHDWKQYVDRVSIHLRSLVAAVIVKCFGKKINILDSDLNVKFKLELF